MSGVLALSPFADSVPLFVDTLGAFFRPRTLFGVLVDGVAKAALYIMIASGLTLIFGLMGVLNFAHGSMTMVGAYLGGLLMVLVVGQETGDPTRLLVFGLGVVVVFAVLAAFGGLLEIGLIRPIYDRPPLSQILLTFGLTLILDELARIVVSFYGLQPISEWQAAMATKPDVLGQQHDLVVASVSGLKLFEIACGILAVVVIWVFLTRTRYGLYVRAGSEDSEMAAALGVDVRRVFTVVFALGTGLGGVAGILLAWDPSWGASVPLAVETLLPAFVVVIIGGLGTFRGTVAAGLLVGLIDATMTWWFQNAIAFTGLPEMTIFLILVIVLVVRPQGLFGVEEVGGH
ncbi:branched-chain amino acid ABC transporter permease [Halocatena pleomorpha]|uniref:Branched-chain amino acid ABC transporter permease n=1 Tax=Halocatena pleomorpha TaxID=1785090 RepID=A0A3P3RE43_9EURY|nr:branched-chain amino acid ABC transporter permease [Halocatena pleomorpha]RRJ31675.1 branched-chain amino acid ABC transporter permease [Halocatena pleomorpha]